MAPTRKKNKDSKKEEEDSKPPARATRSSTSKKEQNEDEPQCSLFEEALDDPVREPEEDGKANTVQGAPGPASHTTSSRVLSKPAKSPVKKKILKKSPSPSKAAKNPYKANKPVSSVDTPVMDSSFLALLNVSPSKNPSSGASRSTRDALLRVALGKGPEKSSCFAFFRVEPLVHGQACYLEKIFADAIYNEEPWTKQLNFEKRFVKWAHNGVDQLNNKNYPIRMFLVPLLSIPKTDTLVRLGKYICANINADPNSTSELKLNESKYVWLDGVKTWQHLTSVNDCLQRLRTTVGPPDGPEWFKSNVNHVLYCFAKGTINEDLARRLYAPNWMVHGFFGAAKRSGNARDSDRKEREENNSREGKNENDDERSEEAWETDREGREALEREADSDVDEEEEEEEEEEEKDDDEDEDEDEGEQKETMKAEKTDEAAAEEDEDSVVEVIEIKKEKTHETEKGAVKEAPNENEDQEDSDDDMLFA